MYNDMATVSHAGIATILDEDCSYILNSIYKSSISG